jgi:hypothetical protein
MTEETQLKLSVSDMLRLTGDNTSEFMKHVADHIDKLETHLIHLESRISELESKKNANRKSK